MTDRPNILLITDDQHRWDYFGATGAVPTLCTPALDGLRTEGTTLDNAWSNCPVCIPTRFTWYHGLYASQGAAGMLGNAASWPTHLPTLPRHLQAAGYRTALIGKLHSRSGFYMDLTSDASVAEARAWGLDDVWEVSGRSLAHTADCHWTRHLAAHGLLDAYREDVYARRATFCWNEPYRPSLLDTEHQADTLIADQACAWLARAPRTPFFLHASFCGPHFPLDPPRDYFERYRPCDMPPPIGVTDKDERRYWQEQRAAYCALTEFVDAQIGRVLAALDAGGLRERTLVVYTTDHGDRLGDNGEMHKSQPEDGSCRTPVVVRLPGVAPAGRALPGLAGAVDLPVSLLRAAGLTDPLPHLLPDSPGRSWWEYVRGDAAPARETVFVEHSRFRMVLTHGLKYVLNADGTERLHDRGEDPDDQRNLAGDPRHAGTLADMRLALAREFLACVAPNASDHYARQAVVDPIRTALRAAATRIPKRPTWERWSEEEMKR